MSLDGDFQVLWAEGRIQLKDGKRVLLQRDRNGERRLYESQLKKEIPKDVLPVHEWTKKYFVQMVPYLCVLVRDTLTYEEEDHSLMWVILNYKEYSFPESMSRFIFHLKLAHDQSPAIQLMWSDALYLESKPTLEDVYRQESEERYHKMLHEYLPHVPGLYMERRGEQMCLMDRSRVAPQWVGTLEDNVKLLHHLQHYDEDGTRLHQKRVCLRKETTSLGDELWWAPGLKRCAYTKIGEYEISFDEIDPWRYKYLPRDSDIYAHVHVLESRTHDHLEKMTPSTYQVHMDQYEYQVRDTHDAIVLSLATVIKEPVVVPCDGLGRFSRLWPHMKSESEFSDLNISPNTHPSVQKKNLTDVLLRADDRTLILMYCLYAFGPRDIKLLKARIRQGKKTLIVDTRPEAVLYGRRVNNMLYETGFPHLKLSFFPHDTPETITSIKFTDELLKIPNPEWVTRTGNKYYHYFHLMKPFFSPHPSHLPMRVASTLTEYVSAPKDVPCYFTLSGMVDPPILPFRPSAKHFVRAVYYLPLLSKAFLPSNVPKAFVQGKVYFVIPEAGRTEIRFKGISVSEEYDLNFVFQPIEGDGSSVWSDFFYGRKEWYQESELIAYWMARTRGTRREAEEALSSISDSLIFDNGLYAKKSPSYEFIIH